MFPFDILSKKQKNIRWVEVSREPNEKLAKTIVKYWKQVGVKAEIKKRGDGRYSIYIQAKRIK